MSGGGGGSRRPSILAASDLKLPRALAKADAAAVIRQMLLLLRESAADLGRAKLLELVVGSIGACPTPAVVAAGFRLLLQWRQSDAFKGKGRDSAVVAAMKKDKAAGAKKDKVDAELVFTNRLASNKIAAVSVAIGLRQVCGTSSPLDARIALAFVDSFLCESGFDESDAAVKPARAFARSILLDCPLSGGGGGGGAARDGLRVTGLRSLKLLLRRWSDDEDVSRDCAALLCRLLSHGGMGAEACVAMVRLRFPVLLAELVMESVPQARRHYQFTLWLLKELAIRRQEVCLMLAEHRPLVMALVALTQGRLVADDDRERGVELLMVLLHASAQTRYHLCQYNEARIAGTGLQFLVKVGGDGDGDGGGARYQAVHQSATCDGCKAFPITGVRCVRREALLRRLPRARCRG